MQINGFDSSYLDYSDFYNTSGPEISVPEDQGDDFGDRKKGNVASAEKSDFDGNPYYDDPQHSNASLPLLGYRRNEELDTGIGSEGARGIAGLGDSLNAYGESNIPEAASIFGGAARADAGIAEDPNLGAFRDRDMEVRNHEMAHLAAAGGLARGGMQLDYQIGPDGKPYAVGGSVQIDTSKGATPEETLTKAAQIEAAAMAPANPSPQDLKVAADARRMAMEARQEISERAREAVEPSAEGSTPGGDAVRAEQVSRVYGAAVSQDASEPAFSAVA